MQQGVIKHILVEVRLIKEYSISLIAIDRIGDKIILRIAGDEVGKIIMNRMLSSTLCHSELSEESRDPSLHSG